MKRENQIENYILAQYFDNFIESQDGGWKKFMGNDSLEMPEGFVPLAQYSCDSARDLRGALQASHGELTRFLDELQSSMNVNVKIEVKGGIAEVTQCPEWINVEIVDHDNLDIYTE